MSKAADIALYTVSGFTAVVLLNQIVKYLNSGKGFLTTNKRMAKYALTKRSGNYRLTTKETWEEDFAWWNKESKEYRTNWYKAIWKAEHGKGTETFTADGKKWYTKGGNEVKVK